MNTEYTQIRSRPDTRDGRDIRTVRPKMGNVETTQEKPFQIYNAVVNKLKEKADKIDELEQLVKKILEKNGGMTQGTKGH